MPRIEAFLSVVIPVYNGEKTLVRLVDRLNVVLEPYEGNEIILVDDNSADSSYAVIKDLCQNHPNIIGIKLARNYGQQSAIFCGLQHSKGDYVVIMDDDLEQNPEDIPLLYHEIIKGYDCVYGVKKDERKSRGYRSFGSWLRDMVFNQITHKPKDLKVCSFRIINRETIDKVIKANTRFVYISMEILKHTCNIENIGVLYNTRQSSGYNLCKLIKLLVKIIVYYSPKHFLGGLRNLGSCYQIGSIVKGDK